MTKDEALDLALYALELEDMACRYEKESTPEHIAKAITAIKQARSAPVQEQMAWKNAAIRLGEELSSVGPAGYYDMTAEQWLDWAMTQQPRGKNSLPAAQPTTEESSAVKPAAPVQEPVAWVEKNGDLVWQNYEAAIGRNLYTTPPTAQRQWVGLTDEEIQELRYKIDSTAHWTYDEFAKAIEAKLKEKNT
jgi:hypothetical protein